MKTIAGTQQEQSIVS